MTYLILLALTAITSASEYHGVTVGLSPYYHPVLAQYHAQDIHGQYSYGFATPTQTKSETKSVDGVTHGGYSYIDSHGHLQTVQYTADPVHGFRVAASNLPVDLPDVAYAKAKHLADFEGIKAEHSNAAAKIAQQAVAPVNVGGQNLPVDLPEVAYAKAKHLADFEGIKAAHAAIGAERAALAVSYSNPVAVAYNAVPQVALLPAPVQELPEVLKARAEHFAAIEATKHRDQQIANEHARLAAYNSANLSPIPDHFTGNSVAVSAPVLAPSPVVGYATNYIQEYVPAVYGPSSQYHAQDGYGQYTYGYTGPWSTKSETRSADGAIRGGYSYIDANGIVQSVHYVADAVHGFRVSGTNIPVDHSVHHY